MAERNTVLSYQGAARLHSTGPNNIEEKPKSWDKSIGEKALPYRISIEEQNPRFVHGTAAWRRFEQGSQTEEETQSRHRAARKDLYSKARKEITPHKDQPALEHCKRPPPLPPQKPAHLRMYPIVEKVGEYIERRPFAVSTPWRGAEESTVQEFRSGGLYLERRRPKLPPKIVLPNVSDSSESSDDTKA